MLSFSRNPPDLAKTPCLPDPPADIGVASVPHYHHNLERIRVGYGHLRLYPPPPNQRFPNCEI